MRLTFDAPEFNPNRGRVIRHSPLVDLVGVLIVFGVLAGWGYGLTRIWGAVPGAFWVVIGPVALLFGGLFALVAAALVGAFLSSLRSTNWLAFVETDGVFLNLRSYRNAHFGGDHPTVLHLRYAEIASIGSVIETQARRPNEERSIRIKTIELCLAGAETASIAAACRDERTCPAPPTRLLGIESRTKHHDVTVFVPTRGVLRVQWNAMLYRELARSISEVDARQVDLDQTSAWQTVEERATLLLLRGDRLAAAHIGRDELGLDTRAAKDWVRELGERAA